MIIGWSFYYLFVSFQEKLPYERCPGEDTGQNCSFIGSTKYYWYHENLDISSGMSDSGGLLWHLCLVLLLAWVIVFCVMMKGLAAAGKVRKKQFISLVLKQQPVCTPCKRSLQDWGWGFTSYKFSRLNRLPQHGHVVSQTVKENGGKLFHILNAQLLAMNSQEVSCDVDVPLAHLLKPQWVD